MFKVGDKVKWASASQGTWREKRGTVVAVVPARVNFAEARWWNTFSHLPGWKRFMSKEPGAARNHESYLVQAEGALYWPRVSLLVRDGL